MLFIVIAAVVMTVVLAARPVATARVIAQLVLFVTAALCSVMMYAVGPEPPLLGAALVAGGVWVAMVVLTPRRRVVPA